MKRNTTIKPLDLEGKPLIDTPAKYAVALDAEGKVRYGPTGALVAIDASGKPIEREPAKEATFRTLLVTLMTAQAEGDDKASGEDKVKHFKLADKVFKADGEIDLTADEVALLTKRAEKLFPWLTYARFKEWLETDPAAAT